MFKYVIIFSDFAMQLLAVLGDPDKANQPCSYHQQSVTLISLNRLKLTVHIILDKRNINHT